MALVDMSGFERDTIEVNGLKIVTYAMGSGPPLVFLHGAGSFTGFDALRPLAAARRLIIPYHPNYGESGDDPTLDSMDDYVRSYMDLFDAMGLASLDLMGFSLGGWMAAEFADLPARPYPSARPRSACGACRSGAPGAGTWRNHASRASGLSRA